MAQWHRWTGGREAEVEGMRMERLRRSKELDLRHVKCLSDYGMGPAG